MGCERPGLWLLCVYVMTARLVVWSCPSSFASCQACGHCGLSWDAKDTQGILEGECRCCLFLESALLADKGLLVSQEPGKG